MVHAHYIGLCFYGRKHVEPTDPLHSSLFGKPQPHSSFHIILLKDLVTMPLLDGSFGNTELAQVDAPAISLGDSAALRNAVLTLEHPSLAARLASLAGTPLNL